MSPSDCEPSSVGPLRVLGCIGSCSFGCSPVAPLVVCLGVSVAIASVCLSGLSFPSFPSLVQSNRRKPNSRANPTVFGCVSPRLLQSPYPPALSVSLPLSLSLLQATGLNAS
ncbi:unnamed protein product [Mortierella alpina]